MKDAYSFHIESALAPGRVSRNVRCLYADFHANWAQIFAQFAPMGGPSPGCLTGIPRSRLLGRGCHCVLRTPTTTAANLEAGHRSAGPQSPRPTPKEKADEGRYTRRERTIEDLSRFLKVPAFEDDQDATGRTALRMRS